MIVPLNAVNIWRVVEPSERKLVVVAPPRIVKPVPVVPPPIVEDATARKPFWNESVVEVACSLVPSFVKGQEKVIAPEPQPVQLVTVKFPILAVFDRRSVVEARAETNRLVDVAFVLVLFVAVKF